MQNLNVPSDARALMNAAFRVGLSLDRKFERSDLTPDLRNAALEYALWYDGSFDFMQKMSREASAGNGLYDGQSVAILNCLMAEGKRRMAEKAPRATVPSTASSTAPTVKVLANVPDGRYRVTLVDQSHLAIKVTLAGTDSRLAGSRVVSTRIGDDEWMGVAHITAAGEFRVWKNTRGELRDRVSNAVEILDSAETQDGWLIAGLAYAQAGSQCFICGRDLDTPESLTAGYGPVCADKHGLPWGAKAVPMSVRLAQAAQAASEPPAAEEVDATYEAAVADLTPSLKQETPIPHTNHRTSPVSLAEARQRGYSRTYAEIFGDDQ